MKVISDDNQVTELSEDEFSTLINNLFTTKHLLDTLRIIDPNDGSEYNISDWIYITHSKYVC